MQLLQFAEPIEKQKVIYFDRRPESSRPQNNNNHFPKKIFDKNSNKNKTEIGIKKYTTYNKKTNNKNDNFIYSNRNPPIEAKEIRVNSVDNYQGEECDIILLSLVRSNKEYKIGFLKVGKKN